MDLQANYISLHVYNFNLKKLTCKSRLNAAITCIHTELVTGKLIFLKPVGTTRVALQTASQERESHLP